MKALIRRVIISHSFGFQYNKSSSICNALGLADYTLLMVAVLALTCSVLPALAQSGNQGAAVNVLEDNPNRLVIRYEFGDFLQQQVVIDHQTYNAIFLKSESNKKKLGAPALPDVSRSIIIPDDAHMAVRVLDSSYYEIENIDIAPSKGYIPRSVNPADVPYTFGKAYETDAFYPGPLAVLREPYIMRDHRGIVVTANPFQYNPVGRVLRVYTDMTIEVVAIGSGKVNVLHRKPRKLSRAFHQLYSSHFINYDLDERYTPLDEEGEMLIIVYDSWNSNVQPLKTHKESLGITTTIVDVGSIGNDATSIKNYIQSVYDSATDLAFVLLVGDYTQVASPWADLDVYDGRADPDYSKLAGGDDYPDIIVGRFSAETAAQVDTQVERTIEYENMPATQQDWFWRAVMIASDQGPGHNGEYDCQHKQLIRDDLLACGYTQVDELYDGDLCGDAPGDPTPEMVSTSVNAGRGFINYTGHGSITSWGTSGFSNTHINALTNDNMLPFIFSVACNNGEFDYSSPCFAEAWMRATNGSEPSGAIGIYASSNSQPWNPPMDADDEFVDLFAAGTYSYFGTLCYAGSCSMMDDNPGDPDTWGNGKAAFRTWHIFGDPSLRIVSDVNTPPVAHDDSVSTSINTPVEINLIATDEGQPDPPGALTYIITSLPSHGSLSDPCDGAITDPCTPLVNYGNKVVYTPAADYIGGDSFTFIANDGGTEPNGGNSNIATITIDVWPLSVVIYEIDFESGLDGWIIDNSFGDGSGLWHLTTSCNSTLSGHTTPTSLYYGQDTSCDYDAGLTEGVVTSPIISLADVSAPIELSFKYYLHTEVAASTYDIATVDISENGGAFSTVAGNSDGSLNDPSGGWQSAVIDLSAMAGSDIQIRFRFRTVDELYNDYPGFYVDDVNVTGSVVGPNCALPSEPNSPGPPDGASDVPVDTLLQWNRGVVINEISVGESIDAGLTDWIELFNQGNSPVELTGWQVTAIRTNMTTVLTIPTFTLAANAYVVLHEISGTDTSTDLYFDQNIYWHNDESGSCALTDADGIGVDFVRWTDRTGSKSSSEPPPVGTNWTGNDPAAPADEDLHTLGRDGFGTDTDDGSDWENTSGVDASAPTPGGSNTGRRSSIIGFENTYEIDLDRTNGGGPVRSIRTVKTAAIEKASVRGVPTNVLADMADDEPSSLPLPRYATPEEQQILQKRRLLRALEPRKVEPRLAPSGVVWTPGEYERLHGVLLAWDDYFQSLLTEFIIGLSDPNSDSTAYVVVDSDTEQASVYHDLAIAGANMDNVKFIIYTDTLDSVWIRDYGPRYFYQDGDLVIMDHNYNRPRPDDNAFPSWLGVYWSETVYQLDNLNLEHGGGNFHAVSDGNAFVSTLILEENPGYTETDIKNIFKTYHNVDVTIYNRLPSSVDPTGHIDMWLLPLTDNDILVSKFPDGTPADPCTEAAVTDLESRGYTVWRTPAWVSGDTHYTYTNAVIVNNRVFIPKYNDSNDSIALSVFQQAMPDHEIIQVNCSSIIPYGGAIHCIMKHIYTVTPPVTWDVYLDTDDERLLALIHSDLTEPVCDPGLLQYCTTYHWQVVAKNCCGETPGEIWSFTTTFADILDLKLLASHWLDTPCNDLAGDESDWCFGTDLDKSGRVDFYDFAKLALCWLECPEMRFAPRAEHLAQSEPNVQRKRPAPFLGYRPL